VRRVCGPVEATPLGFGAGVWNCGSCVHGGGCVLGRACVGGLLIVVA
jgi:hypothetical protein